jgi:hypothetical protein
MVALLSKKKFEQSSNWRAIFPIDIAVFDLMPCSRGEASGVFRTRRQNP